MPAYRNKSVTVEASRYRIVDVFTNGQINNAQVILYAAHTDADHIALSGQTGCAQAAALAIIPAIIVESSCAR